MARSAPLKLGTNAPIVVALCASACAITASTSANCGTTLGGTKEPASISRAPAATIASISAHFASVGTKISRFWRPSRGPTSQIWTSGAFGISFDPPGTYCYFLLQRTIYETLCQVQTPRCACANPRQSQKSTGQEWRRSGNFEPGRTYGTPNSGRRAAGGNAARRPADRAAPCGRTRSLARADPLGTKGARRRWAGEE